MFCSSNIKPATQPFTQLQLRLMVERPAGDTPISKVQTTSDGKLQTSRFQRAKRSVWVMGPRGDVPGRKWTDQWVISSYILLINGGWIGGEITHWSDHHWSDHFRPGTSKQGYSGSLGLRCADRNLGVAPFIAPGWCFGIFFIALSLFWLPSKHQLYSRACVLKGSSYRIFFHQHLFRKIWIIQNSQKIGDGYHLRKSSIQR